MERVAVLFSGGKDSTRTVHWCLQNGYDVKYLVTLFPMKKDSWMFHVPNIHLTGLLSQALEIPLVRQKSSGIKEEEVNDIKKAVENLDINFLACGGIASNYQKTRIEKVCNQLDLKCLAPFWGMSPEIFLRETVDLGFDVKIVAVSSEGFDKSWLGRKLDYNMINDLKKLNEKYKISMVLEGGEGESLVVDGPIFKKKIDIVDSEIVWEGLSGYLSIKKAVLVDK